MKTAHIAQESISTAPASVALREAASRLLEAAGELEREESLPRPFAIGFAAGVRQTLTEIGAELEGWASAPAMP